MACIYFKPIFTEKFLGFDSHHPYRIKNRIVHSKIKLIRQTKDADQQEIASVRNENAQALLHSNLSRLTHVKIIK